MKIANGCLPTDNITPNPYYPNSKVRLPTQISTVSMPPVKEPRKSEKESVDRVEIHMRILTGMNIVYEKKNHDYGDSFAQVRKNIPNAILVRLWDKLNRLTTLLQGAESQISDETIDDTLIDLANYAVMELVEREIDKNV